jgi:hypothetical protein
MKSLAKVISQPRKALLGVRQPASPIEEVKEVRQAAKFEQAVARPGHGDSGFHGPTFKRRGLEAALQVHVDFRLGQVLELWISWASGGLAHCTPLIKLVAATRCEPAHATIPQSAGA